MADWPKKFLIQAEQVTIVLEGHTWEMDGETFVRCMESGGWVDTRSSVDLPLRLQAARDEGFQHGFAFALEQATKAINGVQHPAQAKARERAENNFKEALRILNSINTA